MNGASIFQMISGLGDSFSKSYDAAKKDALTSSLGEKIKSGDYAGAADVALQGGDLKTGLELVKLGETRGASKQLGEALGGLYGGGSAGSGGGFLDSLAQSYRGGSGSPAPFKTDDPVAEGLQPHQKALLNGIAGPESSGRYNVRFTPRGGALFDGFGQHPGIAEMGPEGPSTAAGRYQFTKTTWDGMGGGDFSPANQDRRALQLAVQDYRSRTGRDLDADLQAEGFSPRIQDALSQTWTGLRGNQGRNAATFAESLSRYGVTGGGLSGLPTRVSGMNPDAGRMSPDAANRPAPGAVAMGFQIPEGRSQGAGGSVAPAPAAPAPGPAAPSAGLPSLPNVPPSLQLAGAGVPIREAAAFGRTAPGSPERINTLIRASLIPGLSEQQQGTVKALLAYEQEQGKPTGDQRDYALSRAEGFRGSFLDWKDRLRGAGGRDEGAKIEAQIGAREAALRARGMDPNDPANRRYLFTGSMPERRTQMVEGRDGQRHVVDMDNPAADPTRVNIPDSPPRMWGAPGPDGQIVQAPPGVAPNTPGYYDAKGVPEMLTGKGVNVTNQITAGETEEQKKLGGLRGERAAGIEASAAKATEQIGKLNLLERALQGVRTGTLGPAESTVVGFAQSLGIPDETIAKNGLNPRQAIDAQTATKLINESVVGMIGSGGFPANNFSNADRDFLTDIFPKISNRPEANQTAIEVLRRIQKRNVEIGDAWAEHQQERREAGKPVSVAEFEFNVRKGLRGKADLFSDLRRQVDAPGRGGDTSADGGSGALPAFDPGKTKITMEDGKALKGAPDTAENRRAFDERYGEGAARYVLERPLASDADTPEGPAPDAAPKTIARGASRKTLPPGVSSGKFLDEARKAIAAGRDRGAIEDRLRAYGFDPARLGE